VLLPVEWVPATVPAADADLLVREGFFLGIRAVTAFPTGVAFRLVIRVRDENVVDGVDYRAICGHSLRGSPPPAGGLAVRAQAETAGAVSECQIWPGSGGGRDYSDSGDFVGTRVDYNYWLPIPPDAAAVALVAAWPDQDVAESRLRLDLDAIRAAAHRAVRV
jgi:hypothetical protein